MSYGDEGFVGAEETGVDGDEGGFAGLGVEVELAYLANLFAVGAEYSAVTQSFDGFVGSHELLPFFTTLSTRCYVSPALPMSAISRLSNW